MAICSLSSQAAPATRRRGWSGPLSLVACKCCLPEQISLSSVSTLAQVSLPLPLNSLLKCSDLPPDVSHMLEIFCLQGNLAHCCLICWVLTSMFNSLTFTSKFIWDRSHMTTRNVSFSSPSPSSSSSTEHSLSPDRPTGTWTLERFCLWALTSLVPSTVVQGMRVELSRESSRVSAPHP